MLAGNVTGLAVEIECCCLMAHKYVGLGHMNVFLKFVEQSNSD